MASRARRLATFKLASDPNWLSPAKNSPMMVKTSTGSGRLAWNSSQYERFAQVSFGTREDEGHTIETGSSTDVEQTSEWILSSSTILDLFFVLGR